MTETGKTNRRGRPQIFDTSAATRAATPWRLGRWTRRDPRDRATAAEGFRDGSRRKPANWRVFLREMSAMRARRGAENDRRIPTALARPAYAGRVRVRQTVRGETRTISSHSPGGHRGCARLWRRGQVPAPWSTAAAWPCQRESGGRRERCLEQRKRRHGGIPMTPSPVHTPRRAAAWAASCWR